MDIIHHQSTSVLPCPVKVLRNWSQNFVTWLSLWPRMDAQAKLEITKGNYNNALVIYEHLLADEGSQKFEVLLGKAQTLILLDQFKDVVDCYRSALAISELKESHIVPFIDGLVKKISTGVPLQKPVDTTYEQVLCQICRGITVDPTTLPCGHTNCQSCIAKLANKVCKFCNKPFCSYKVRVNVVLQEILKKYFPSELKATCIRLEGNTLLKDGKPEQALEKYLEATELREYTDTSLCLK
jgi:tetratricopeptide (TPR) repeat protein